MEALEATTTNDGVYLTSGHSREEAKEKILQLEVENENITLET